VVVAVPARFHQRKYLLEMNQLFTRKPGHLVEQFGAIDITEHQCHRG
jgi:hypothetical protein